MMLDLKRKLTFSFIFIILISHLLSYFMDQVGQIILTVIMVVLSTVIFIISIDLITTAVLDNIKKEVLTLTNEHAKGNKSYRI